MSSGFSRSWIFYCTLFGAGSFMNVWYFLLCCWGKSSSFLFRFNPRFPWPAFPTIPPLSSMSLKNSPQKNQVLFNQNVIFLKLGWVRIRFYHLTLPIYQFQFLKSAIDNENSLLQYIFLASHHRQQNFKLIKMINFIGHGTITSLNEV